MDDKRLAELRDWIDTDGRTLPYADWETMLAAIDELNRLKGLWQWMAENKVYPSRNFGRDWLIFDERSRRSEMDFDRLPHKGRFDTPLEAIQAYRAFKEGR